MLAANYALQVIFFINDCVARTQTRELLPCRG